MDDATVSAFADRLYARAATTAAVPGFDERDALALSLSGLGSRKSRYAACMLGLACGDALGYPVEFAERDLMPIEWWPDLLAVLPEPALVSDDTQMTVATAHGLLDARGGSDAIDGIRGRYLAWHHLQLTDPAAVRAPGMTCMDALSRGGTGTVEGPINDSKGCGGVMRTAPCGLVAASDVEAYDLGTRAAALTHGHPDGWHPAGLFAVLVRRLLLGEEREAAVGLVMGHGKRMADGSRFNTDLLWEEFHEAADPEEAGEGWTGDEALVMALIAFLRAGSYVECVRLAASVSGDSDSVACIAGAIAGAHWGVGGGRGVPLSWASRVEGAAELCSLACRLGPRGQDRPTA